VEEKTEAAPAAVEEKIEAAPASREAILAAARRRLTDLREKGPVPPEVEKDIIDAAAKAIYALEDPEGAAALLEAEEGRG
jgi:hypothetical protein